MYQTSYGIHICMYKSEYNTSFMYLGKLALKKAKMMVYTSRFIHDVGTYNIARPYLGGPHVMHILLKVFLKTFFGTKMPMFICMSYTDVHCLLHLVFCVKIQR
jgi:hypothetical protein